MDVIHSRYVSSEPLGKGSLGVVYRVYDRLAGNYVALKRIEVPPQEIEMNPMAASSRWQHTVLAHEFRLLSSLRHPNIISVLDYGFFENRKPFFVMELLEHPRTVIEAGQSLDARGKTDLLIQMLQALAYLHRHRIVHRDLKPSNVLVNARRPGTGSLAGTATGLLKVLDFGVAVKRDEHQDRAGTMLYMAPEVISGQDASEASDLYAVGVMAYEMFTGVNPFAAESVPQILKNIQNAIPDGRLFEPLIAENPAVGAIAEVIFRLLAKKPSSRYPHAVEVIRALCQAIGESLPPDEGPIRESFLQAARFVGRSQEMDEFQWALQEARDGHGCVWLVGGESGVGKSRLLDELRTIALSDGFQVARGQVAEGDSHAIRCWGEILRPLLLSSPPSDVDVRALKAVVPDIDTLLDQEIAPYAEPDETTVTMTIAHYLSSLTEPTLLVLEDAQWADQGLQPLHLLTSLIGQLPLMIVCSYRSDEAPKLPEQLPGARVMKLERLTYADTAELSASMLGQTDPQVLEALYKETEGNAFFMVETIRAWAEEAGQLGEVGQTPLPEAVFTGGMAQIIRRRLSRVPDWAYGGLQVAAVMGRELDLAALDKILSPMLSFLTGKDISVSVSTVWREQRGLKLNDWLLVCSAAGILEVHDGKWRFTHDKLREQIYADLKPEHLRLLNRQVARVHSQK